MSQLLDLKYQEYEWHNAQNHAVSKRQNGKFKEQNPGGFNTEECGQKGMKMWLIPPKKTLSWMCMGAPVCQECLLPAIFHCAETCTQAQRRYTFISLLAEL